MSEKVTYYYGSMTVLEYTKDRFGNNIDVDMFSNVHRYTIAFTKSGKFGIAICSNKDRFVKRIGRELALKRLEEKPIDIGFIKKINYFDLERLAESIIKIKCPYKYLINFDEACEEIADFLKYKNN